jgi:hypothetical protein
VVIADFTGAVYCDAAGVHGLLALRDRAAAVRDVRFLRVEHADWGPGTVLAEGRPDGAGAKLGADGGVRQMRAYHAACAEKGS